MASERRETALTLEEFTEQLAADLDRDAEAIRSDVAEFEIAPPWEAEVETVDDPE